jgi:hypothetical protein
MDDLNLVKPFIEQDFSGKYLINGDYGDNCFFIRILFDKPEMVHPVLVSISLESYINLNGGHEERTYICNNSDLCNSVMKTDLIYPDFLIKEYKIRVINIESQVA